MSAARKKLRALVFTRAKGRCECGCGRPLGENGHWDHFFGRGAGRPPESERTTWALSFFCDTHRTINKPSAAFWLRRFRVHCQKHGFTGELELADARLAVLFQKGLAA